MNLKIWQTREATQIASLYHEIRVPVSALDRRTLTTVVVRGVYFLVSEAANTYSLQLYWRVAVRDWTHANSLVFLLFLYLYHANPFVWPEGRCYICNRAAEYFTRQLRFEAFSFTVVGGAETERTGFDGRLNLVNRLAPSQRPQVGSPRALGA